MRSSTSSMRIGGRWTRECSATIMLIEAANTVGSCREDEKYAPRVSDSAKADGTPFEWQKIGALRRVS